MVQSHLPPFRNLGNLFTLSGVYARGNKISHIGGKCVTCSGLTNSREEQLLRFGFLAEEIVLMLFHIYYANVFIFNKQQFVIKHERPPSSIPLGN